MKFKQKFAYMALGGLLAFMGQLLPNMLNDHATAQNEKESAEFDEVKRSRLEVVDATGRTLAVLNASGAGDVLVYLVMMGSLLLLLGKLA